MTEQERTILKGMYAAGFRYVVRDEQWILFSNEKFVYNELGWDLPRGKKEATIDDLGNMVNGLFDWIKADDKEPVEIVKVL